MKLMDKKFKKADKFKFLGVIIDENLTWDDQIKHLENKLLATIVLIKRVKKFIPSSHHFKIYQSLFLSHLTYGISCWGGVYYSKLHKLFNIQKRCIRILFGESYSFDHPEYYATCCRTKTYQEHGAFKNYAIEHTKPLFDKHNLLTLPYKTLFPPGIQLYNPPSFLFARARFARINKEVCSAVYQIREIPITEAKPPKNCRQDEVI